MATLCYEPCTQFINVSQRTLHICWQFSAMSHAIHKIVSKNAANLISYRGVRRITPKVKTVICEQAPNHGSYFAYAWLCFRNSQLFAILQQIQRLRDNSVRVAFFQFRTVTEAPEDTYGEGACRLAGLHICGGISHVEYFVCGETEPV